MKSKLAIWSMVFLIIAIVLPFFLSSFLRYFVFSYPEPTGISIPVNNTPAILYKLPAISIYIFFLTSIILAISSLLAIKNNPSLEGKFMAISVLIIDILVLGFISLYIYAWSTVH